MHLRIAVAVLMLFPWASVALGQVAAPSLFPPMPRIGDPATTIPSTTLLPENPALIQWGPLQGFGVAALKSTRDVGTQSADYDDAFLGLQFQTKALSFVGSYVKTSNKDQDSELVQGGGAFGLGDVLAVGASTDDYTSKESAAERKVQAVTGGIALRLGWLYLGAARRSDSLIYKVPSNSSSVPDLTYNSKRGTNKVGVGILAGKRKSFQVHLEAYHMDAADYLIADTPVEGRKTNASILEVKLGPAIVGVTVSSVHEPSDQTTSRGLIVDAGWERVEGIGYYLHHEEFRSKVATGAAEIAVSSQAFVLAFRF